MEDGINIDPNTLIQVLQNKLAQSTIREAQMEAALQGLINQIQKLEKELHPLVEVNEDVSSADKSEQG